MLKTKTAILALSVLVLAPLMLSASSIGVASAAQFMDSRTIGTVTVPKLGTYYIMLERYCLGSNSYMSQIVLRRNPYQCSPSDKYVWTTYSKDWVAIYNAFCTIKSYYDTGKLIGGCFATGACIACGVSGCGGGFLCAACVYACSYMAFYGGGQDCVFGIYERVTGYPAVTISPTFSEFGHAILDTICH
jgi:hypothetical protein